MPPKKKKPFSIKRKTKYWKKKYKQNDLLSKYRNKYPKYMKGRINKALWCRDNEINSSVGLDDVFMKMQNSIKQRRKKYKRKKKK